jgi:hypothetical protein
VTAITRVGAALIILIAVLAGGLVHAQVKTETPATQQEPTNESLSRLFSIQIPEGFKPQALEEPGIFRWKKGPAEISLVIGELFAGSPEFLLKALTTAGEENKLLEEVKPFEVDGAKAVIFKDRPASEPGKLRNWKVMALTEKRCFSLDMTAPEKDFPGLEADFAKALASFKVKDS